MDTELLVNKAFDAGLQAVFEAIFAGGDSIVDSAAGQILVGKKYGVHLGVNSEVVFHRALRKGHFGLIGTLNHAVVAERNDAFVLVDNHATHFAGRVFGLCRHGLGDLHKIFIPILLFAHIIYDIITKSDVGG